MDFFLKKNDINEINRAKLMMKYQTSKTFSENLLLIEEKISPYSDKITLSIGEQATGGVPIPSKTQSEKDFEDYEIKKQQEQTYPNYCPYKEYTVVPSKNYKTGAEGVDAIPQGWCFYKTPVGGLYLPVSDPEYGKLEKMAFSSIDGISRIVDKIMSKEVESDNLRDSTIKNISRIIPTGSIVRFYIDSVGYNLVLEKKDDVGIWYAKGFRNSEGVYLEQPINVDIRTDYQKFADKWLVLLQLSAAITTAILAPYISAEIALFIELTVELGFGTMAAQRELEKGDNVAAASSILLGLLPVLKLTKWYRGIDPETFTSLAKKMAGSGLNKNSTVEDYVKFYNKLNPKQQKLMTQMLEQDKITRDQMLKEIALKLGKPEKATFMIDDLLKMAKESPETLKKLSFTEKLWARELTGAGAILALYKIVNTVWGKELNNEQKQAIEWLYTKLPETLKKEYLYNLLSNSESLPEIANNVVEFKKEHIQTGEQAAKNLPPDLLNYITRKSVKSSDGEYQEIDQDTNKAVDIDDVTLNQSEVDSLGAEGWVKKDFVDLDLTKEIKEINGFYYEKQN